MKRGEANKKPVIITYPNGTKSYCSSIKEAADTLKLKRDCVTKSLKLGYFKCMSGILIQFE